MTTDDRHSATDYADDGTVEALVRLLGAQERIETQAAHVLLTADSAWKIKKRINLGFLDYSTASSRRRALEAEFALNRRTAPDLYVAVHTLTRDAAGRIAIDGSGDVIDSILEMRRFPDAARLDRWAGRNGIEPELLVALAEEVARLHGQAKSCWGRRSVDDLRAVILGNAERFTALSDILEPAATAALCSAQRQTLDRLADKLRRRSERGRVRHGHGDLHLRNIAVLGGKPILFDCLEFDANLATTDVGYDLAFLLMDLCHEGLTAEANAVFNRYCDISSEDEDVADLMPLFLSLRAAIRSHVHATQASQGNGSSVATARSYLALAQRLLEPRAPRLLVIGGLSGTGKSTLARALAARIGAAPGARILRSDVLRKRLAGLAPETRLAPASYTAENASRVYERLASAATRHLAEGTSVIADAAFLDGAHRRRIAQIADGVDAPVCCLWLETKNGRRLQRVAGRHGDASDADTSVAQAQSEIVPGEHEGWRCLRAEGAPNEVAMKAARTIEDLLPDFWNSSLTRASDGTLSNASARP